MWLSSGAAASTAKQSGTRTLCRLRVCCPLEAVAPRGWRYYEVGCCVVCTGWGCWGIGLLLTASSVMANTSDVTRVSAAITTAVHARGLPRRLVRRCTMPAIRA